MVELGVARTGTATGGSTSTIIDTARLKDVDDDYYNDGTMFILKDAGGAGAAPQKEFLEVANFSKLTSTLSARSGETFSAAVVATDVYGVSNRRFPLHRIIEKLNMILFSDIYFAQEDVSLTTVQSQLEYVLPSAAMLDLREVWVSQETTSLQEDWIPVLNYEMRRYSGSEKRLVLQNELEASQTIRLIYGAPHPDLRVASDELNEEIHPDIVVYAACRDALQEYVDRTRLKHLQRKIDDLNLKAQRASDAHPIPPLPNRKAKVTRVSRSFFGNMDNITRYGRG